MKNILERSIELIKQETGVELSPPGAVENIILDYSDGDARRMLNLVEMIFNIHTPGEPITGSMVMDVIQKKVAAYDRTGDERYELISAFHKSVRNSEVDAALFWLYRMMAGGEDPLYILRRMIKTVSLIGSGSKKNFLESDFPVFCLRRPGGFFGRGCQPPDP